MRAFLIAATILASTTAHAGLGDLTDAQKGLGLIIAAQETCGLVLDETALGEYFVQQGWDQPETLATINFWAKIQRATARNGASPADCIIIRKTAESLGVMAD